MRFGSVFRGKVQSVPNLGNRIRVNPLIIARAADVIEVILDCRRAAARLRSSGRRQTADVAPVVVAP